MEVTLQRLQRFRVGRGGSRQSCEDWSLSPLEIYQKLSRVVTWWDEHFLNFTLSTMTRSLEENTPSCGFCSFGEEGWYWLGLRSDTRNGKRTGLWCLRRLDWLDLVIDWMWEGREKGQGKDALQFSGWETKWMFLNMQNLRCSISTFFLSFIPVIPNRQYPVFLFPTSHEERAGKNLRNHVVRSASFYIQGHWDPERLENFSKGTEDPQPLIPQASP